MSDPRPRVWKILGGKSPYPYLQGGPECGFNYWIYLGSECYGGPYSTPKACRSEAASRLLEVRSLVNLMRSAKKILRDYRPQPVASEA